MSTAKAALATYVKVDGMKLGLHEDVQQFMTGKAKILPRIPKYQQIWDPQQVIDFLITWSPAKYLSLLHLSMKTVTMLLLVSGQRPQILNFLTLDNMEQKRTSFKFTIQQNLKHSRAKTPATVVSISAFPGDKRVCPVNYLKAYLSRTEKLRNSRKIFISTTTPHEAASLSTMTRWIKNILNLAGIDTTVFSTGSTRAAAANAADRAGVPLQTIMAKAAWQTPTTFNKWYKKPLTQSSDKTYQKAILSKSSQTKERK